MNKMIKPMVSSCEQSAILHTFQTVGNRVLRKSFIETLPVPLSTEPVDPLAQRGRYQ